MNYFILNKELRTVAIAQTDSSSRNAFHVLEDTFQEYSNAPSTLDLTFDFYNEKALEIKEGAHVVFEYEGKHRLFQIKQVEEYHATDSYVKVYAEESSFELLDAVVFGKEYTSVSAEFLLNIALTDTDWQVGNVDDVTLEKFSFSAYSTALSTVQSIATETEFILGFRVKFSPQLGVTGKYVDLVEKTKIDEGKRLEFGRNVESVKRTVDKTTVCTAVIPVGSNDTLVSGFDWVNNYDDKTITKVKDLYYLSVDEKTRSEINPNSDHHLFYVLQDESSDKSTLCQRAYEYLKNHKEPKYTYEVGAITLRGETYSIGEQVRIIDDELGISLVAEVEQTKISFCNPDSNSITLTNYVEKQSNVNQLLYDIQNKLQTSVLNNPLVIVSPDKPIVEQVGNQGTIWIDTSKQNADGIIILNKFDIEKGEWLTVQETPSTDKVTEELEEVKVEIGYQLIETVKGLEQKILKGDTFPTSAEVGQLFIHTGDNDNLYRWNGTEWVLVGVSQETIDEMQQVIDDAKADIEQSKKDIEQVGKDLDAKAEELQGVADDLQEQADALKQRATNLEGSVSTINTNIDNINGQLEVTATKTEVQQAIDNIEIGGRNLIPLSSIQAKVTTGNNILNSTNDMTFEIVKSGNIAGIVFDKTFEAGTYTLNASFEAPDRVDAKAIRFIFSSKFGTNGVDNSYYASMLGTTNGYFWNVKLPLTFTLLEDTKIGFVFEDVYGSPCHVTGLKLEKGNKATDWTPAPEDAESKITENTSKITVNAQRIESVYSELQTTQTAQGERITKAESDIVQNANLIASKVSQTEIDTAINNLQIGGRNLLIKTQELQNYYLASTDFSGTSTSDTTKPFVTIQSDTNQGNRYRAITTLLPSVQEIWDDHESEYTFSFDAKLTGTIVNPRLRFNIRDDRQNLKLAFEVPIKNNDGTIVYDKWIRCSGTAIVNSKISTLEDASKVIIGANWSAESAIGSTMEFKNFKLEKGNKATDYTPAPEDTQSQLDAQGTRITNAESTIEQHAGLIASKVSQETYESDMQGFETRISDAESTITQTANSIESVVSEKVQEEIEIQAGDIKDEILGQVNSDYTEFQTRLASAESAISQKADSITLEATKTELLSNIQNIKIGGRNYLENTTNETQEATWSSWQVFKNDVYTHLLEELNGEEVTMSGYIDNTNGIKDVGLMLHVETTSGSTGYKQFVSTEKILAGQKGWLKHTFSIVMNDGSKPENVTRMRVALRCYTNTNESQTIQYHSLQVEKGNMLTDWKPAPEDAIDYVDSQITDTKAELKVTTDAITANVTKNTTDISGLQSTTTALNTAITQNASDISLRATKTELTEAIDGIKIGGRNLFKMSSPIYTHGANSYTKDGYKLNIVSNSGGNSGLRLPYEMFEVGKDYVLSFKFKKTAGTLKSIGGHCSHKVKEWFVDGEKMSSTYQAGFSLEDTEDIHSVEVHLTINLETGTDLNVYIQANRQQAFQVSFDLWDIQLEEGNKVTAWKPAPEDVDNRILQAEASIQVNSDAITQQASKITAVEGKVNTNTASIKTNADAIALRATKTEMTDAINSIEVGGRNYVLNSDVEKVTNSSSFVTYNISPSKENLNGKTITFSWEAKKDVDATNQANMLAYLRDGSSNLLPNVPRIGDCTTEWKRYSITVTIANEATNALTVAFHMNSTGLAGKSYFRNVKLEIGNKATDWTPAPEDTDTRLVTVEEAALTVLPNQISSKVSNDTYTADQTALNSRLDTMNTAITQKADSVTLEAVQEELQTEIYDAVGDITIGGTNLLKDSGHWTTTPTNWVQNGSNSTGGMALDTVNTYLGYNTIASKIGTGFHHKNNAWIDVDTNKTYTYSAMIKSDVNFIGASSYPLHYHCSSDGGTTNSAGVTAIKYDQNLVAGQWKLVYITFKPNGNLWRPFIYYTSASVFANINVAYLKLEEGNKPTAWSANPDEVAATMSQINQQVVTNKASIETNAKGILERVTQSQMNTQINTAVNNIQLGGTNLLRGTAKFNAPWRNRNDNQTTKIKENVYQGNSAIEAYQAWGTYAYPMKDLVDRSVINETEPFTLSFYARSTSSNYLPVIDFYCASSTGTAVTHVSSKNLGNVTTSWKRYTHTFTFTKLSSVHEECLLRIEPETSRTSDGVLQMANFQLEKGNKVTDWKPSPQDILDEIVTSSTEQMTIENYYAHVPTMIGETFNTLSVKGETVYKVPLNSTNFEITGTSKNLGSVSLLKPNTTYTLVYNVTSYTAVDGVCSPCLNLAGAETAPDIRFSCLKKGINKQTFSFTREQYKPDKAIMMYFFAADYEAGQRAGINNLCILEGDWTDKALPLHTIATGVSSVGQLDDLTIRSTGRNLLNLNAEPFGKNGAPVCTFKDDIYTVKNLVEGTTYNYVKFLLRLKPNTVYTAKTTYEKVSGTQANLAIYGYTTSSGYGNGEFFTFTAPTDGLVTVLLYANTSDGAVSEIKYHKPCIYEGQYTSATMPEYEPYKEQVTVVPETVLRRIPNTDIYDEITSSGQLIKRVGAVTFDGSESWVVDDSPYTGYVRFKINHEHVYLNGYSPTIHNRAAGEAQGAYEYILLHGDIIYMQLLPSRLASSDLAGFTEWLTNNPVTVLYELKQPIVTELPVPTIHGYTGGQVIIDGAVSPSIDVEYASNLNAWLEAVEKANQTAESNVNKIQTDLIELAGRVSTAEIKLESDSIISTVLESETYANLTQDYVVSDDIYGMATKDDVNAAVDGIDHAGKIDERLNEHISNDASILNTHFATQSQIEQTKDDITMKFSQTGGINLVKNSLGYNGVDDGNWKAGSPNLLNGAAQVVTNNYYGVAGWTPVRALEAGKTYTATISITPASDVTHYALYLSNSYQWQVNLTPDGTTNRQELTATFKAAYYEGRHPSDAWSHARVDLYRFPNIGTDTAQNTTVHWIKIEEGAVQTEYTNEWDYESNYITCGYDPDAEGIGFESSICLSNKPSQWLRLMQPIKTVVGKTYTFSCYYKLVKGHCEAKITDSNYVDYAVSATEASAKLYASAVTDGYQFFTTTFVAKETTTCIKLTTSAGGEAYFTGIMVNIGDKPFGHTFARGEVYNTNINFDMNGIQVIQLDSNGNRVGYTMITPQEFAGYYDTDGDGSFEKIFYLNKDAVVSKRSVAEKEIIMGKLKFINLDDNNYCGWALVPSTVNDWQLSQGTDQ